MKLWRIRIRVKGQYTDIPHHYTYCGTATNAEIACRQVRRAAKKDNFVCVEIEAVECIGDKEFGR